MHRLVILLLLAVSALSAQNARFGGGRISWLHNHNAVDGNLLLVYWDYGAYPAGSATQVVINLRMPSTYDLQNGSGGGVDGADVSFTGYSALFAGGDYLLGTIPDTAQPWTILSVNRPTSSASWPPFFHSNTSNRAVLVYDITTMLPIFASGSGSSITGASGTPLNVWELMVGVGNGVSSVLYRNTGSIATGNIGTGVLKEPKIGQDGGGGANFRGDIAQTLVYLRTMAAWEEAKHYAVLKRHNAMRGAALP